MNRLPVGEYRLPSLDEYKITVIDYTLREVTWEKFMDENDWPAYEMEDNYKVIFKTFKKPKGIRVIMPENHGGPKPYEIIWAT